MTITPASQPAVTDRVPQMYIDSLKKIKSALRKDDLESAFNEVETFFNNQEILAEYFHQRTVSEVHSEMKDRIEQARTALAPVFAEHPERVRIFMDKFHAVLNREFEEFKKMKGTIEDGNPSSGGTQDVSQRS